MLFVVQATDDAGGTARRKEHYPAHMSYLDTAEKWNVRIVISGPLLKEDGETPSGSLFILEAPDRAAVESFHRNDPFHIHKIWGASVIMPFIKKRG
jgi:uncharacterized protein YciI